MFPEAEYLKSIENHNVNPRSKRFYEYEVSRKSASILNYQMSLILFFYIGTHLSTHFLGNGFYFLGFISMIYLGAGVDLKGWNTLQKYRLLRSKKKELIGD